MIMDAALKQAAELTPDPERAFKNLERFAVSAPDVLERNSSSIGAIARLFAYSQFLAEYSFTHPNDLVEALLAMNQPVLRDYIMSSSRSEPIMRLVGSPNGSGTKTDAPRFVNNSSTQTGTGSMPKAATPLPHSFKQNALKFVRDIKYRYLLRITLRDIMGLTDISLCMFELSELAEAIAQIALDLSHAMIRERFGMLDDNSYCILALGKLGAGELNYSSDIDIMAVYKSSDGLSTGTISANGLLVNRIEPHEYYCRLTETLTNLLQAQTENGFAYRVDLRLRPNGRKGELALSEDAYAMYYESWGQTWERMALLRARPIAGDITLGRNLIEAITPFIWHRSSDFYEIEEIRELKKKIDTVFDANDIKRGYGGIREIEFFIQTFQLLYGGERERLRTHQLHIALKELLQERFLIDEDVDTLAQSYLFLRHVEHVLQMRDNLQTHTLPAQPDELDIVARKLNFGGQKEFLSELKLKRLMVRDMYNSLLGGPEIKHETDVFLEDELADNEIRDYLAFKGFKNPDQALNNIKALNEQVQFEKTIRERTLLRKSIPMFLDESLRVENKDRALSMFTTFIQKVGEHESYIDLFSTRPDTVEIIIRTFSDSKYFSRALLSLDNLESIFEYPDIRMDYAAVKERLAGMLEYSRDPMASVREFKTIEELRAGLLFLKGILDIDGLSDKLSIQASTIVRTVLQHLGGNNGFAVIGLGKFGAAEMNIGSDLDLIFIADNPEAERLAEELIKFLAEYTDRGIVYEIDMRLRPDGSKGILVNTIEGYRNYYLKAAHPWEIQALLRARSIAGDRSLIRAFNKLKKQAITLRGGENNGADMRAMRRRIIQEVSRESSGYDIKLGPGGVEEIEFLIQYLQLKHASQHPDIITHRTTTALNRLTEHGIINADAKRYLSHTYAFMRTIDTLRRINDEHVLKPNSELADVTARFFEFGSRDELFFELKDARKKIDALATRYYI
ncbi:MAG TPA: hypothetical protein VGK02_02005 [Candidatus Aquicultor sp.]|jgi:glutamate-ammonia-ligase adenylyltransferase